MTETQDMLTIARDMTDLIAWEVFGRKADPDRFLAYSDRNFEMLLILARKHDLSHLVADVLLREHLIENEKIRGVFEKELYQAVLRYETKKQDREEIKAAFQKAEIPFVPLKGAVIASFYPEGWQRTSCDTDVLVHREDLARAVCVLTDIGFHQKGDQNYHDVKMISPGNAALELHFSIQEAQDHLDVVLKRAWEFTSCKDGYEYAFTNEFFLFHQFAHASYHFVQGGCGVRPFLDLCLIEKSVSYDRDVLENLLKQAGILTFAREMEKLSGVWFAGEEPDALTQRMEQFIVNGGVYGSMDQHIRIKRLETGGKGGYILSRIFLPRKSMEIGYPEVKKYPILLPFAHVRRWCRLLRRDRRAHTFHEIRTNAAINESNNEYIETLFASLGLNRQG